MDTVETRLTLPAPPARVWEHLLFYEQIRERPPLHLRLLLPTPLRTEGRKSRPGDEATCVYADGWLVKRVTHADGREYRFDVVGQRLRVGGGIRLSGGAYRLREVPGGTEVTLVTRYASPRRPRWLFRPAESVVCHAFDRHLLRAMRRTLPAAAAPAAAPRAVPHAGPALADHGPAAG